MQSAHQNDVQSKNGTNSTVHSLHERITPALVTCATPSATKEKKPGKRGPKFRGKSKATIKTKPRKFDLKGSRIVSIQLLSNLIQTVSKHSIQCEGLCKIVDEIRHGMGSEIIVKCAKEDCSFKIVFRTTSKAKGLKGYNRFLVNYRAVWGQMSTGGGHEKLTENMSCLNVPVMSKSAYLKIEREIGEAWHEILSEEIDMAGKEELSLAKEHNNMCDDGFPFIKVVIDGGWSKRSHGHSYDAKSGVVIIIGKRTKKPLYIGLRNKFCSVCAHQRRKGEQPRKHLCFKNWEKSSREMESDALVEGFQLSEKMHGLRYLRIVGDGDSSVLKEIRTRVSYGHLVEKNECANHACKNLRSRLEKFLSENPQFKGKGRLTAKRVKYLVAIARKAIKYRSQTLDSNGLVNDFRNAPYHVFGDHSNCIKEQCRKKQEKTGKKAETTGKVEDTSGNEAGKLGVDVESEMRKEEEMFEREVEASEKAPKPSDKEGNAGMGKEKKSEETAEACAKVRETSRKKSKTPRTGAETSGKAAEKSAEEIGKNEMGKETSEKKKISEKAAETLDREETSRKEKQKESEETGESSGEEEGIPTKEAQTLGTETEKADAIHSVTNQAARQVDYDMGLEEGKTCSLLAKISELEKMETENEIKEDEIEEAMSSETGSISSLPPGLLDGVKRCFDRLVAKASDLVHNETSNLAECYMNIRCKFDGGKVINRIQKGSFQYRSYGAALQMAKGADWSAPSWKDVFSQNAGEIHEDISQRRACKRKYNREKQLTEAAKRRRIEYKFKSNDQTPSALKAYGEAASQPDVTPEQLKMHCSEYYEKEVSNVTEEFIVRTMTETTGQTASDGAEKWRRERRKRLTSSDFGKICKMRQTTKTTKFVENKLYGKFQGNEYTDCGLQKEAVIIDRYKSEMSSNGRPVKVQRTGFWISKENPWLGCSPDGLVTDDNEKVSPEGGIECKYLPSIGQHTFDDVFRVNKARFSKKERSANVEDHSTSEEKDKKYPNFPLENTLKGTQLKRNHNHYFQVLGNMALTKRQWWDYALLADNDFYTERIYFNRSDWEKAKGKLKHFYFSGLLPELALPRFTWKQEIRDMKDPSVTTAYLDSIAAGRGIIQPLASSSKIIRQPFMSVAGANIEVQKSEKFKKDNEFGSILHAEVKDIKEFERSTEISSLSNTQAAAAIRRAKNTIRRRQARFKEKH